MYEIQLKYGGTLSLLRKKPENNIKGRITDTAGKVKED
jgi:hypothetical protein